MEQLHNQDAATVEVLAELLMGALKRSIGELDLQVTTRKIKTKEGNTETTTEVREIDKGGIVDRGGLKQLTSALKELQSIRGEITELERREREAKIDALCRSAGIPDTEESGTGVILLPERKKTET